MGLKSLFQVLRIIEIYCLSFPVNIKKFALLQVILVGKLSLLLELLWLALLGLFVDPARSSKYFESVVDVDMEFNRSHIMD